MTKDEIQKMRDDKELEYLQKTINEQLVGIANAKTLKQMQARVKYLRSATSKYLAIAKERVI